MVILHISCLCYTTTIYSIIESRQSFARPMRRLHKTLLPHSVPNFHKRPLLSGFQGACLMTCWLACAKKFRLFLCVCANIILRRAYWYFVDMLHMDMSSLRIFQKSPRSCYCVVRETLKIQRRTNGTMNAVRKKVAFWTARLCITQAWDILLVLRYL